MNFELKVHTHTTHTQIIGRLRKKNEEEKGKEENKNFEIFLLDQMVKICLRLVHANKEKMKL